MTTYRPEIDGLRAVAVLPVIFFHAGFSWFSGGFIGVDVFFVISGYLITSILLDDLHKGTFSLLHFYERRARRILPALFFVMAACIPFAWIWLIPRDLKDFGESLAAVATFSSNILFLLESGYFETEASLKPLLHTWSLAVEEQYYILFPLLLMALWKLGIRWIVGFVTLVMLVSLASAQWGAYFKPTATFYLLPTRGWEILMGALAAIWLQHNTPQRNDGTTRWQWGRELTGFIGLALIIIAIVCFDRRTPFPSVFALVPTLGALLIILGAHGSTVVARLLGSRIPVAIGLMSYSAYLWHQPVLAFGHYQSLHEPSGRLIGLLCLLTFPLAWLTWRYVEAPFRDRKRFSRRYIFTSAAIVASLIIALGLTLKLADGVPQRLAKDVLETAELGPKYIDRRDSDPCTLLRAEHNSPGCVKGKQVPPKVGLIGDSHAAALVEELTRVFEQRGQSFVQYTEMGCPFAVHPKDSRQVACGQFVDAVARDVEERGLGSLIVLARWSFYLDAYDFESGLGRKPIRLNDFFAALRPSLSEDLDTERRAFLDTYVDAIRSLQNGHRKDYVVLPVPEQAWDIPRFLAKNAMQGAVQVDAPTTPLAVYKSRHADLIQVFTTLAQDPSFELIDSSAVFCNVPNQSGCVSSIDGEPLYYDDNHLTNRGSAFLIRAILKQSGLQ